MAAFQLGPLVLSAPRFYAGLGLLVLVLLAELLAWRGRRAAEPAVAGRPGAAPVRQVHAAGWAWAAVLAVLLGARLGYVIENLALFARDPVAALQFWQGGFSPWWGVGAGVAVATLAVWRRRVSLAGAGLPAVLALVAWLAVPALFTAAPSTARHLPSLRLETLAGEELELGSLRGQPVVLNLWATWCPPCRRELPMLAAAARTYPDVHFVFADQAEPRATVAGYLDGQGLELGVVVLDTRGQLGDAFGGVGLPMTLFFDAGGDHVLTHFGEVSSVAMINYLSDLRSGRL